MGIACKGLPFGELPRNTDYGETVFPVGKPACKAHFGPVPVEAGVCLLNLGRLENGDEIFLGLAAVIGMYIFLPRRRQCEGPSHYFF